MDVLIQQDGRIQTNQRIDPRLSYYRTIELVSSIPYPIHRQTSFDEITAGLRIRHIERTFVRLGTEGDITVWVENR